MGLHNDINGSNAKKFHIYIDCILTLLSSSFDCDDDDDDAEEDDDRSILFWNEFVMSYVKLK